MICGDVFEDSIILIFSLSFIINLSSNDFSFDSLNWTYYKKSNDMDLFINRENKEINAYRVKKTLFNLNGEELVKNIMNFENYSDIFPKTKKFKLIKEIDKNCYLMYSIINFHPLKDRDYYIILNYDKVENNGQVIHTISWHPITENYKAFFDNKTKENERVFFINGRWQIVEYEDGKLTISAEMYNNWKINVSSYYGIL